MSLLLRDQTRSGPLRWGPMPAVERPGDDVEPSAGAWTRARVLEAAADWIWEPEGAVVVATDDYQLVRYPDRLLDATFPAAQVVRLCTERPVGEVLEEIRTRARAFGLSEVHVWVSEATRPPTAEAVLGEMGADLSETVRVLSLELVGDPWASIPSGARTELVSDERTLRDSLDVARRGWERQSALEDAELRRELDQLRRDLLTWSSFRVVGYLEDEPVSTGGCSLVSGVARLWGAVTLPAARRRGAYRAVLAERLRLAAEHGAGLALVKGRTVTSAPILVRAGFRPAGEERRWRLPVG